MIGPNVEISLPPASWFTFPPSNYPRVLLPPTPNEDEWTWKAPFAIDPKFYNDMLKPELPVTFAALYIITVFVFNSVNRRRGNKPFGISKTTLFSAFTLYHNAILAAYSAFTCAAMVRAVYVSFPGWTADHGLPGAVDALCKMNGPRGYGDAITYNSTSYNWASKNHKILLSDDQLTPDITDVGRIWNEGLAFWGWMFYMSKYYEVVDNVVNIVKGKRVSTLQMYHHAGALLCMWAGIRYMSPPIWMFVMVNSGIHAFMYTYYALTTVGVRPAQGIKKTITTLQILQFIVGMSYAAAHLFISYSAPVPIAYTVRSILSGVPSAVSSAAQVAATNIQSYAANAASTIVHDARSIFHSGLPTSSLSSAAASLSASASSIYHSGLPTSTLSSASATLSASLSASASSLASEASVTAASLASTASASGSSLAAQASTTISALASAALANDNLWLKKLLYRAAGREALAEAITNEQGVLFGPEFDEGLIPRTVEQIKEEVRYRTEYQTTRCLDYEGQAFAIWLNVLYLLPLTGLFLRFFTRTYNPSDKESSASGAARKSARQASDTIEDAGKRIERRFDALGEELKESSKDINYEDTVAAMKRELEELRAQSAVWKEKFSKFDVSEAVENVKENVEGAVETVREKVSGFNMEEAVERVKREIRDFDIEEKYDQAKEGVSNVVRQVMQAAEGGDGDTEESASVKTEEPDSPTLKHEPDSSTSGLDSSVASVSGGDDAAGGEWTPARKAAKKTPKKSGIPTTAKKPAGSGGGAGGSSGTSSSTTITGPSSGAVAPRDPSTISSLASHSHVGNTNVSGSTNSSSHRQHTSSSSSHMSSSTLTDAGSESQTFERVERGGEGAELHRGPGGAWKEL